MLERYLILAFARDSRDPLVMCFAKRGEITTLASFQLVRVLFRSWFNLHLSQG
jgi:hypothetical protein